MDDTSHAPGSRAYGTRAARLALITDQVNRDGFVSVDQLVGRMKVSRMTVHRDLNELQQTGVLHKVRGGASAQRSAQFESDLPYRARMAQEEKRAISEAAAELTSGGDVVIIDDSTTALGVIPHIVGSVPLTVITNFMMAMESVIGKPETSLVALGGDYIPRYRAFLGVVCEDALSRLYADVLFASASAMRGLAVYHQDQRVVTAKRAMMRAAARRVLLMDSTKMGHGALHRLGTVDEFTHIVVDDGVDESAVRMMSEAGVEVIVAPTSRHVREA